VTLFSKKYLTATLCFWASAFVALFMVSVIQTWLPQIMRTSGYSLATALSFLLVFNLGTMIGTVLTGAAMDRFGSKSVCALAFLAASVSLVLITLPLPLVISYLLVAIAGIGTLGTQALILAYITKYYSPNNRATAVGWALGIGRIGAITGPTLGGLLLMWQVAVQWNFYIMAVAGVLGAIALLFVTNRREGEEMVVTPSKEVL
jgi:AAHS family benzoate transporter-like MFS transporter